MLKALGFSEYDGHFRNGDVRIPFDEIIGQTPSSFYSRMRTKGWLTEESRQMSFSEQLTRLYSMDTKEPGDTVPAGDLKEPTNFRVAGSRYRCDKDVYVVTLIADAPEDATDLIFEGFGAAHVNCESWVTHRCSLTVIQQGIFVMIEVPVSWLQKSIQGLNFTVYALNEKTGQESTRVKITWGPKWGKFEKYEPEPSTQMQLDSPTKHWSRNPALDTNPTPIPSEEPRVWAKEFCKVHGGDEGLMTAWFANALQTGRDLGRREQEARTLRPCPSFFEIPISARITNIYRDGDPINTATAGTLFPVYKLTFPPSKPQAENGLVKLFNELNKPSKFDVSFLFSSKKDSN